MFDDFRKCLIEEKVDVERAKYGERLLDNAHTALDQLRRNTNFVVGTNPAFANLRASALFTAPHPRYTTQHNVIAKALEHEKMLKLLAKLAEMFDDPKKQGNRGVIRKYIEACKKPGAVYSSTGTAANLSIDSLYNNNCLAQHALITIANNFTNCITQICNRVFADWEDINKLFFPNDILVSLAEIKIFDSDPHKGGKRVCCLYFEVFPANPVPPPQPGFFQRVFARGGQQHNQLDGGELPRVKLIYKPFDLELDYRVVADTATISSRVTCPLPANPTQSLFEILNPQLPKYLILPRNFGSSLAANPNGDIPNVRDSYGYLQFLTHEPDRVGTSGAAVPLRDKKGKVRKWSDCKPDELDWITTDENDVTAFYKTMGWYMAIGMVFSFMDGHQGNVMVHNKKPYLIDLEIAFKSPTRQISSTMYDRALTKNNDLEGSAMFNQLYFFHGKGEPQHSWFLKDDGSFASGTGGGNDRQDKWFALVKAGFDEALDEMRKPGMQTNLVNWIRTNGVGLTITRVTVEGTSSYYNMLEGMCSGRLLESVPTVFTYSSLPAWCKSSIDIKLGSGEVSGLQGWIANSHLPQVLRPIWATYDPKHNLQDQMNWDIPAYYRRVSTQKLLNSRGTVVDIPRWQAAWDAANPVNEWWWNAMSASFTTDKPKLKQLLQNPLSGEFLQQLPSTFVADQITDLASAALKNVYDSESDWIMGLKTAPGPTACPHV